MNQPERSSYDAVPYLGKPFPATHPDRLATVARLRGLAPPPPATARVLELGCGQGINLIAMAEGLPGARFVGVDLSAGQIAEGRALAEALGLDRVTLRAGDLGALDAVAEADGPFDYILCHGVYSWVPEPIREAILRGIARRLSPAGLAYVSYNTYPGWHEPMTIREMLLYHDRPRAAAAPAERIGHARALLGLLTAALPAGDSPRARLLVESIEHLQEEADYYLFHEYLEDENRPLYFHEFAERARSHGLHYVAEAQPDPISSRLSRSSGEALDRLTADPIEREQYLDFLRNRSFRRTLLGLDPAAAHRPPRVEAVPSLLASALGQPESAEPDVTSEAPETFRTSDRVSLTTVRPLAKATLLTLARAWPAALPFEAVLAGVDALLGDATTADDRAPAEVAEVLFQGFESELVEFHAGPPRYAAAPGPRPAAPALARLQAAGDGPVANLRHRHVRLDDPFERLVLRLLDGRRDREALLAALVDLAAERDAVALDDPEGRPIRDPEALRAILAPALGSCLDALARQALLLPDDPPG